VLPGATVTLFTRTEQIEEVTLRKKERKKERKGKKELSKN